MTPMAVDGTTRVVAVLGYPVAHSRSPAMHNRALSALGLNWVYVPCRVAPADLGRAIRGLRALNFAGANVTIPHKERVMRFLDDVTPEARAIGAVNTVVNRKGRLWGTTTDPHGILMALKKGRVNLRRSRAVILGTGGSARTALFTLIAGGCRHAVAAGRRPARAKALALEARKRFGVPVEGVLLGSPDFAARISESTLLINATPVGLTPATGRTPIDRKLLHPNLLVFDMVYNPLDTRLLREAREKGARTVSGIEMLIHQGLKSFELWTGKKAPERLFRKGAFSRS